MGALRTSRTIAVWTVAMTTLAGCGRGPARVKQPTIDPAAAGARALEAYDTDRDGRIAGAEFDAAPALKAALTRLDANQDGGVSADEIAARVKAWKGMVTGLAAIRCHVTLDGKPVANANVTLTPEPFLGDAVRPARGVTNQYGDAAPTVAEEDKPAPNLPGGVHLGLYTVAISKLVNGKESIPKAYHAPSRLGVEVSYDEPGIRDNNLAFRLKSAE